jgi:hypothetical protein
MRNGAGADMANLPLIDERTANADPLELRSLEMADRHAAAKRRAGMRHEIRRDQKRPPSAIA